MSTEDNTNQTSHFDHYSIASSTLRALSMNETLVLALPILEDAVAIAARLTSLLEKEF